MNSNFHLYYTESIYLPEELKEADIIFVPYIKGETEPLPYSGFLLDSPDYASMVEDNPEAGRFLLWNLDGEFNPGEDFDKNTVYFEFRSFPDLFNFRQIFRNYREYIEQQKERHEYLEEIARKEVINKKFLNVGIALSAERDNRKLLDFIVAKTREITFSDAGSLYLIDENRETGSLSLLFKIAHNDSNPTDFTEFSMPVKKQSIAGFVALTGEVIKLKDAYEIPEYSEYNFNKDYDRSTGYRSKSMLTVPMKNHKGKIIGVIQLINKKVSPDKILDSDSAVEKYVKPFEKTDEEVVLALASLAAVSLDNNQLYSEIENLFECLVKASAKAIEQRDPATSGHSLRVAQYTVSMAGAMSEESSGRFRNLTYTDDQLKGLRYACLLHDFGKVGVRENVLVKAKKLYPGMLELIMMRLDYIRKKTESELLRQLYSSDISIDSVESTIREKTEKLEAIRDIVINANETTVLSSDPGASLASAASEKYTDEDGTEKSILTPEEYDFLSIAKGCLNNEERAEIQSHVRHTYDFLKNIPWPEDMSEIPEIARGHHEALDGTGYPDGKNADSIPFESKIMAVADIYDALTASDRPYKKAVPADRALKILKAEAENGKLDSDIVSFFIEKEIYNTPGQS